MANLEGLGHIRYPPIWRVAMELKLSPHAVNAWSLSTLAEANEWLDAQADAREKQARYAERNTRGG